MKAKSFIKKSRKKKTRFSLPFRKAEVEMETILLTPKKPTGECPICHYETVLMDDGLYHCCRLKGRYNRRTHQFRFNCSWVGVESEGEE